MSVLIVVLGKKLKEDCMIHIEHISRCLIASSTVQGLNDLLYDSTTVIFTGGKASNGCYAEAKVAEQYFLSVYSATKESLPKILIEDKSRTTAENIMFARRVVEDEKVEFDTCIFIGRKSQLLKTQVLVRKLWPMPKVKYGFVAGMDTKPLWYRIVDQTVMVAVSWIDPEDKWLLWPLKKLARNG